MRERDKKESSEVIARAREEAQQARRETELRVGEERAARLRVEEEARKQRDRMRLGLTIAGAGLGLAIVGAVGVGVGFSEYQTAKLAPNINNLLPDTGPPLVWTTIGGIATGLGMAAIIGGAIVANPARNRVSIAIAGTPGSTTITFAGAF